MANLDDLPAEIRTTIVGLAMKTYVTDGEYATERQKFRFACNLSLVSRAMNETAGPFIFRKYRLDIRQNEYDWRKTIYPPRSERMRWDEDLIAQRLAHLRSKAEHVRVIVLKDYGPERDKKEAENDPPPFPPQLMPSLMAALHTLRYVTGVSLITGSFDSGQAVFLPHELWHWIHTVHPVEFAIQGDFKITPEILTPTLESVTALKVKRSSFTLQQILLDAAQNATRVTLHSMWGALCLIKPVNPRLGSIDISLEISSYNLRAPLFDFSAVPQAQVNVELFFSRSGESQLQISSAWAKTRPKLKTLFAENLCKFDVLRDEHVVIVSRSPDPGWRPSSQDQVEDTQQDRPALLFWPGFWQTGGPFRYFNV